MLALSQACLHKREMHMLQWLCSKGPEGKLLWSSFIEQQSVGVGELLCLFPSCLPTFATLATHCPKMSSRLYSITTSQRQHPLSLSIAFSVVHFTASVYKGESAISTVKRKGLCTSYLERLLGSYLDNDSRRSKPARVLIYPKTSTCFYPPLNTRLPLVI